MISERRVISYVLWGDNPTYIRGAIENILLAEQLYPEWTCRFYVASDSAGLSLLRNFKCDIVVMPPCRQRGEDMTPLFWRMFSILDGTVDRIIFRDCDSRPTKREALAVQAWVDSKLPLHVMRDHEAHCNVTNMPSGMWGCIRKDLEYLSPLLRHYEIIDNRHIVKKCCRIDEFFLEYTVWNVIGFKAMVHGVKGIPFPIPNENPGSFIGKQVYYAP